jgi:serine/threonine protein kinase
VQVFARKLLRPSGSYTMKDVENEVRAVAKLCSPGTHKNIVLVLRTGKLPHMPFYYIDMELCDLNLERFIKREWRATMTERFQNSESMVDVEQLLPIVRLLQLRDIMRAVSGGVAFIHAKHEIHRDLKPRNSSTQGLRVSLTSVSFVFRAK